MPNTIAMLLAGGQGSRLSILSGQRAKPAVPFGGNYRIIDFTISNVMHSGIRHLGVLTQYRPYSLMAHIGLGEAWGFSGRHSVAKVLPPYQGGKDSDWYAGTADAIYQNLWFIERFDADTVVVLSGDHIYRADYNALIDFHNQNNADLTLMTQQVPWEEAGRFGVLKFDARGRIEAFVEKPKSDPPSNQINLGIYVFKAEVLARLLREDAENPQSTHDFGHDIIPRMVAENNCYAMEFTKYWRDVGTLQSLWDANMECLDRESGLNLCQWKVLTNTDDIPLQFVMPAHIYGGGNVIHSVAGKGSRIQGRVTNSILFRGVEVGPGAEVRDSVLMDGVRIGANAKVTRVISDKWCEIGAGAEVGVPAEQEAAPNEHQPNYLTTGITLLGKHVHIPDGVKVGGNCLFYPGVQEASFTAAEYPSGSAITN